MFDNYTKDNDEDRDKDGDEDGDRDEDAIKEYVKDKGHESLSFINGVSSGSPSSSSPTSSSCGGLRRSCQVTARL